MPRKGRRKYSVRNVFAGHADAFVDPFQMGEV